MYTKILNTINKPKNHNGYSIFIYITFEEKKLQSIVFSTHYVFTYLPPSTINGEQNNVFRPIFFDKPCHISKIIIYIWSKNNIIIDL